MSSSAHVVVAEKLLGLDPSSPPMTLLLVMLHTGTMIAVIVYFWRRWKETYFKSAASLKQFAQQVVIATAFTAVIGEVLIKVIEKTMFRNAPQAEIEDLFSHLEIIAPALAIGGLLILCAGIVERRGLRAGSELNTRQASVIGAIQGLCLPFRGFSRSGATISAGMLAGVSKARAESFSFALAIVLTPPVVGRELLRLMHDPPEQAGGQLIVGDPFWPSRCSLGILGWSWRLAVVKPLVGSGSLVFLWYLLSDGSGDRGDPPLSEATDQAISATRRIESFAGQRQN